MKKKRKKDKDYKEKRREDLTLDCWDECEHEWKDQIMVIQAFFNLFIIYLYSFGSSFSPLFSIQQVRVPHTKYYYSYF
jgi:hypothetical protein